MFKHHAQVHVKSQISSPSPIVPVRFGQGAFGEG